MLLFYTGNVSVEAALKNEANYSDQTDRDRDWKDLLDPVYFRVSNLVVVIHSVGPSCFGRARLVAIRPLHLRVTSHNLWGYALLVIPRQSLSHINRSWLHYKADDLLRLARWRVVLDFYVQMVENNVLIRFFVIVSDWDAFFVVHKIFGSVHITQSDGSRESI